MMLSTTRLTAASSAGFRSKFESAGASWAARFAAANTGAMTVKTKRVVVRYMGFPRSNFLLVKTSEVNALAPRHKLGVEPNEHSKPRGGLFYLPSRSEFQRLMR